MPIMVELWGQEHDIRALPLLTFGLPASAPSRRDGSEMRVIDAHPPVLVAQETAVAAAL